MDAGARGPVTSGGQQWRDDGGPEDGDVRWIDESISWTRADTMYRSYRVGVRDYSVPLESGVYEVRLHLLEPTHTKPGKRVVDIRAEGVLVLDDVDVVKEVGRRFRSYDPAFRVEVTDGSLDLEFDAERGRAVLAGLELSRVGDSWGGAGSERPGRVSGNGERAEGPADDDVGEAPEPPEIPAGGRVQLRWAPPPLEDPVKVQATDERARLTLESGRDYVVELPRTPLTAKGGLQIVGGRNVVLVGGEIRAPRAEDASASQRRGLLLKGQTGTVHVEGIHISGPDLAEGIQLDQRLGAVVQLQNIRVDTVHGSQAGNHADVLQTWAGPRRLLVDGLSGSTGYQGTMLNPNDGAFGGGDRPKPELFDFRRVDIDGNSRSVYLVWLSKGARAVEQLNVSDFWLDPSPQRKDRDSHVWPKPNTGDGTWDDAVTGLPERSFVPADETGIGYVSPGYW